MDSLEGHTCDLLFMCVPGWQRSPDYVESLPRLVKPGVIIPFHYDDFTRPLGAGSLFPVLPFINMDGFISALSRSFPKADILLLKPNEELLIHNEKDPEPNHAYLLTQMEYPELPVPFGVFRDIDRPTYDDMLNDQVKASVQASGEGSLKELIYGSETWSVQ